MVRGILSDKEFVEVYVRCPMDICEQRDVKGLYRKARTREIENFTGIDSIYEEPDEPNIVVDTNAMSIEECVTKICDYVYPLIHLSK